MGLRRWDDSVYGGVGPGTGDGTECDGIQARDSTCPPPVDASSFSEIGSRAKGQDSEQLRNSHLRC